MTTETIVWEEPEPAAAAPGQPLGNGDFRGVGQFVNPSHWQ